MFIYILGSSYLIYSLYNITYILIVLFYINSCENYSSICDFLDNSLHMNFNLSILTFLLLSTFFYYLEKLVTYILNTIIFALNYIFNIQD
jgi:hypothetical protein